MSYLPYFCLLAYSGIQHILCCVFFVLLVLVLLPVSLDCPILLARSVFSYVYLKTNNAILLTFRTQQNLK